MTYVCKIMTMEVKYDACLHVQRSDDIIVAVMASTILPCCART